jgi:hypothetical protein
MAYEIRMCGGGYGTIYAEARDGGMRVVGGIAVKSGSVTLSRRLAAPACWSAAGMLLGYTIPDHRETIRLPLASWDALAIAHETLTEWSQ